MKQKKYNNKRRNAINMKNKRIASSSAPYKPIKPASNNYQKNNYDTQTDNKKNNRNIDMSMGLEEDKKKLKTKPVDQKEEKPSSPKEAVTTTTSSRLTPPQSEVFDSSSDNAMSEMKQVADMGPGDTSKVFSRVEEKRQLNPLTTSADDTVRKAVAENNLNIIPAKANPTLQEIDRGEMESKEEDVVLMQDVKPDIPLVHKESEKQNQLDESVRFNDELNKEYRSNSLNNDKNNNPFISGMKLWQAYNELWNKAYSEYMKTWKSMFKTNC